MTTAETTTGRNGLRDAVRRTPLVPLIAAYAVALAPTYLELARGPWNTEQEGHGPFIVAAVLFLVWRRWETVKARVGTPADFAGWASFVFGLLMMIVGRSQALLSVEVASQIPIVVGLVLIMGGWSLLRVLIAPILLLVFTVPLPAWIMDAMTLPLKNHLSTIVSDLLYNAGYPIAQNGVVLTIGPYELLVKDACAGLNSMFSLSAISLFYIFLIGQLSVAHGIILYACVLPVSFIANAIRVLLLVLGTYYFGDIASRGFFHDFTGILLFTVALASIFLIDALLRLATVAARRMRTPGATA